MTTRSQEIVIEIDGMTSAADEKAVGEALLATTGVTVATASRAERLATVTADPAVATPEKLRSVVFSAGFTPGEVRFPE